jgi:hypothetical protein
LRLAYLRNVEDPYGPRVISFSPSYTSNPYIVASSLADADRWPELAQPSSPQLSDDEQNDRPSGFPGATGLKYTQTIMGPSRSGALGLRVEARRHSTMTRKRHTSAGQDGSNFLTESAEGSNAAGPSTNPFGDHTGDTSSWVNVSDVQGTDSTSKHAKLPETPTGDKSPPPLPAKDVQPQFIPRFKGAAEMEERRKMRMLARRQGPDAVGPPPRPTAMNPELSSSEEDVLMSESDGEDNFEEVVHVQGTMDDGDEFDP